MNKKLIGRLLLVFVIIVLIPAAVIYFTFDIRALEYLTMFKPWSIAAAFGILAVGLIFDGLRLMTLARVTDERLSIKEVINVVLSNYFLAVLTPGASGGAIAQIMFMKRANVPVAKATVIVFVRTIMSITFLILLVPFVLYNDAFLSEWMPPAVIAAVSVIFISIPVAVVLLMRTRYPEFWLVALTGKLSRKCFNSYYEFKKASFIMGRHPLMILRAFIESGISLLGIYATVPMFFLGMNIQFDWLQVMGRMVLLNFKPGFIFFTYSWRQRHCRSRLYRAVRIASAGRHGRHYGSALAFYGRVFPVFAGCFYFHPCFWFKHYCCQ